MTTKHTVQVHLESMMPPWSSLLVVPHGATASSLVKPPAGFALRTIHGKQCGTSSGVFQEFAQRLDFPDYFGHNWDALEECLADLEWLPSKGYVLLITDAEAVIPNDEEEYETFLEILNDAGEAWSKGQTASGQSAPFHVFFAVSEQKKLQRTHWGLEEIFPTARDTHGKTSGTKSGKNVSSKRVTQKNTGKGQAKRARKR